MYYNEDSSSYPSQNTLLKYVNLLESQWLALKCRLIMMHSFPYWTTLWIANGFQIPPTPHHRSLGAINLFLIAYTSYDASFQRAAISLPPPLPNESNHLPPSLTKGGNLPPPLLDKGRPSPPPLLDKGRPSWTLRNMFRILLRQTKFGLRFTLFND